MKKILFYFSILFSVLAHDLRAEIAPGAVTFDNFECTRIGRKVFVSMDVCLKDLRLKSEEELVFTPVIYAHSESREFPEFRVTGRNRYYRHLRNNDTLSLHTLHRYGSEDTIHYEASVPYAPWMETSRVAVLDNRCGCPCRVSSGERTNDLAAVSLRDPVFEPDYVYIEPQAKEVVREAGGTAYIDFVVNRTEIREDYRHNSRELSKIIATVDSIRTDPDVRITSLTVKGFASPEGSYAANTRLARERTEALKDYLKARYAFPASVMQTASEPEDWEGFRRLLSQTRLQHRDAILAIIADSTLAPDPKERLIRSRYPDDYRFILSHIYPALRHSDYTVRYKIRSYTDVEEARRVMQTRPGNLSEHEFYMVAQTCKPGTEEFNEIFDIMVRIYPGESTANLNAANVAMQRGDLSSARKFLDRVKGHSPEADYARANLACLMQNGKFREDRDYTDAVRMFRSVMQGARPDLSRKAAEALRRIESMQNK